MIFQDTIGIDISTDRLRIALLRRSFRKITLLHHLSCELDAEQPVRERLNAVSALTADFRKEHGTGKSDIFISVPPDIVMFQEIEFPTAVRENLGATLRYEMEKYVPLPVETIRFDYQVVEERKGMGKMTLLLAVAKSADIDPYLDFCRNFPGDISGIGTQATALYNCRAYADGDSSPKSGLVDPLSRIKTESVSKVASKLGIVDESLLPAFGLGLRSLADVPVQINLLPEELRRKPGRLGQYVMIGILGILLMTGLAWAGSFVMHNRMAEEARATELQRLAEAVVAVDRIENETGALEIRMKSLAELVGSNTPVLDILRELTQTIPETAWVQEFSYSTEKGGTIIGLAESASELIPLLEASPLLKNVVFSSAIRKDREGKERFAIKFEVDAYLNSDADIQENRG